MSKFPIFFKKAFSIIGGGGTSKFGPQGQIIHPVKKGRIDILYCIPHFCIFYGMQLNSCTFCYMTLNKVESMQSTFLFPALTMNNDIGKIGGVDGTDNLYVLSS